MFSTPTEIFFYGRKYNSVIKTDFYMPIFTTENSTYEKNTSKVMVFSNVLQLLTSDNERSRSALPYILYVYTVRKYKSL